MRLLISQRSDYRGSIPSLAYSLAYAIELEFVRWQAFEKLESLIRKLDNVPTPDGRIPSEIGFKNQSG